MVDTLDFYNCLIENNLDFFVGVPDSLLKQLCLCISNKSDGKHNIITANEGNAVAMAAGYHISSGKYGVCYMQNSGLGNTVNPIISLTDEEVYNIPFLMIVGWRGEPGVHDEPQHIKQGKVTLEMLELMDIEYLILDETYKEQISYAYKYMKETNKPIAFVVKKGLFSDYDYKFENNSYSLSREDALSIVVDSLNEDDFIVSTTGMCSREIFEIRERNNQNHTHDFLTVGSMGHTSSIALGMAIGTNKNIYCIDGDGSFIMHMGSAAILGQNIPDNFKYIIINNGAHDSVGGQPTAAFNIEIEGILKSCGIKNIYKASKEEELKEAINNLKQNNKSALIIYCKKGARKDLGRPTISPKDNKKAIMEQFKK